MRLMLRGDLLERAVAPQRRKRHLRFELVRGLQVFRYLVPSRRFGMHLGLLSDFLRPRPRRGPRPTD